MTMAVGLASREDLNIPDEIQLRDVIRKRDRKDHYAQIKRLFDVAFSACALLFLLPLSVVIAVVIFCDDPHGSPVFMQIRVGKDGRQFRFYKFRTMVVDAEARLQELRDQNEMEGHAFKIKNDPRITRVGKFLRETGLDELPQLVNVLKGDMSVVGPRPPLPEEVEEYTDYERLRLLVNPGLTCYWQTQHNRNELSFQHWVELDIRYILERNFWVDLKLICRTVYVMLRRDGR